MDGGTALARVNVETRALAESRFYHLMEDLKLTRTEAIGLLVIFWHDSQERLVWRTGKADLLKFIQPTREFDREAVFQALLKNDYISACSKDRIFTIKGNQKHVKSHQQRKTAASVGGKKKRYPGEPLPPKSKRQAHAPKVLARAQPNSIQYNTDQYNSDQIRSDQSNSDKKIVPSELAAPAAPPPVVSHLPDWERESLPEWETPAVAAPPNQERKKVSSRKPPPSKVSTREAIGHYCNAYKARHGSKPAISNRAAGQIGILVKDHGLPEAKRLIDGYLRMSVPDFVRKKHDVGTLLLSLNVVAHYLQTGDETQERRKTFAEDRSAANRELYEKVKRGEV